MKPNAAVAIEPSPEAGLLTVGPIGDPVGSGREMAMDSTGLDDLARQLDAAADRDRAHRAFGSLAEVSGAARWALAEMRRGGEGGFVFDVLASSSAGGDAPIRTVGPCAEDRVLARTWRARDAIELRPSSAGASIAAGLEALLGAVADAAIAVLPIDSPDPSRRVLGVAAAGEGADIRVLRRGFALYGAFFARLRKEANLPTRVDLSRREIEVLQRCAHGLKTDAIAAELEVSAHTVREHIDRARLKLDARNLSHAVALAMRAGLIR
ncbi:Hypothetical protein MexAM1_META2p0768 (plasmid) [Methylorubrum extorquens AM1]|uniref:HTH luxR-type domain-containing protein n=2 Tax=Methylorubrum extorquens TaxID=408 RepID=C5B579_METEA|nr:Hypothetical protein MexAM1_META2p0768 [Methylorubrum extorquens AM1]